MPTGWFTSGPPFGGHPFLPGTVRIPRLNALGRVVFLVDTGCSVTTLHPWDSSALHLDFGRLIQGGIATGIGGSVREYAEDAEISFLHGSQVITYLTQIDIAPVAEHNSWLPSLLGMEIIRQWRMICDFHNSTLEFDVHHADLVRESGLTP